MGRGYKKRWSFKTFGLAQIASIGWSTIPFFRKNYYMSRDDWFNVGTILSAAVADYTLAKTLPLLFSLSLYIRTFISESLIRARQRER